MQSQPHSAYDVVVVGGGPAGVTAALRCRELGATVALIEKGQPGGTCTNDGCVPTRVLARAARLMRDSADYSAYGLVGERPTVDFEHLISQTHDIVYAIHEKKQLIGHLRESGVDLYLNAGPAAFTDSHTVAFGEDGQQQARADKLILCVGGHARRLGFPGAELALTHSDVWSLRRLPGSIAIVGAAATGCQLATIFSSFGARTTLLELAPRIVAGEDEAVSAAMEHAFRKRGIEIMTGVGGVERIEARDPGLRLHYKHGGDEHALDVEAVVLAAGWPGNADTLNLPAAGVESERGYVRVDDRLQTSAPHIFAAGDVTGRMMLVQSANADARIAAENAVLGSDLSYRHHIVPHGGFTDPEYASVGLTETQAKDREPVLCSMVPYGDMDRAVIDGHTDGMVKLVVSAETHKILGAHVVGEQALEVIHMVAAGMAAGMTVDALAALEIAYPTYAAAVGVAARRMTRESGAQAPEWRSLGKRVTVEWERSDI